ncbi:unnamed protein product [Fusarium graminearum]|uniref:Uncharacterized protein n=1 Tax=Gibberella zeae TaxID=5518 RepID=A0A4E9E4R8_GIBZA|nr:unnamed protein product [Fusarium graminearum]
MHSPTSPAPILNLTAYLPGGNCKMPIPSSFFSYSKLPLSCFYPLAFAAISFPQNKLLPLMAGTRRSILIPMSYKVLDLQLWVEEFFS